MVQRTHPETEGHAIGTRRLALMVIVLVGLGALAPLRGMPRLDHEGVDPLPVHGLVLQTGHFVGTVRVVACTLDTAGRLRLTGLLTGTATRRTGAKIPVTEQPFTAPAILHDPGHTADVITLTLAPIALDSAGVRIRLAPITVDLYALADMGEDLATLLP
jgi:hypothetical protein